MDALGPLVGHGEEQDPDPEQRQVRELAEHRSRILLTAPAGDPEQQQQHPDRPVVPGRDSQEEHQRQTDEQRVRPTAPRQRQTEQEQRGELQGPLGRLVRADGQAVAALVRLDPEPAGEVDAHRVAQAQPLAPVGVLLAVVRHVAEEVAPARDAPGGGRAAGHEEQRRRRERPEPQTQVAVIHRAVPRQSPDPQDHRPEQEQSREHPHHRRVADEQTRPHRPPESPGRDARPRGGEPVVDPDLPDHAAGVAEPGHEREEQQQRARPPPGLHAQCERAQQQQGIEQDEQGLLPGDLDVQQPDPGPPDGVPGRRRVVATIDDDVRPEEWLLALQEPGEIGGERVPPRVGPHGQPIALPVLARLLFLVGLEVPDELHVQELLRGLPVRHEHLGVQVVVAELLEVLGAHVVVERAPELHLVAVADVAHVPALDPQGGADHEGEQSGQQHPTAPADLSLPPDRGDDQTHHREDHALVVPALEGAQVPADVDEHHDPRHEQREEHGRAEPLGPGRAGLFGGPHRPRSLPQRSIRALAPA